MRIAGIDPGLRGAIAVIDCDRRTLATARMPIEHRDNGKNYVDGGKLAALLRDKGVTGVVLEDVYSSPQMGVVSAFTFGQGKGVIEGVCAALGIEVIPVSPARWKADLGTTADKDHTKALARRLFPACRAVLKSEGACEAALIGLWGALGRGFIPAQMKPAP